MCNILIFLAGRFKLSRSDQIYDYQQNNLWTTKMFGTLIKIEANKKKTLKTQC